VYKGGKLMCEEDAHELEIEAREDIQKSRRDKSPFSGKKKSRQEKN
jgi:hypothetical protein